MANGNGSNNGNGGLFSFLGTQKKFGIDQAAIVYNGMSPLVERFGSVCQKVDDDKLRSEFNCLMNEFVPTSITCAVEAQGAVVCIHEEGQSRVKAHANAIIVAHNSHHYFERSKKKWIDRLTNWIQSFQNAIDESQRRRDRLVSQHRDMQSRYQEVMSFFKGSGVNNGVKEISQ